MKESTKVDDNILSEYIMNNNSEIPQTNKHLLTPHSLKNNLNIKIQSRRNSLKNNFILFYFNNYNIYLSRLFVVI